MPKRPCLVASCRRLDCNHAAQARARFKGDWPRRRKAHLLRYPMCVVCDKPGADTVNHGTPWRESLSDSDLQSMHRDCHNRHTARGG